VLGLRLYATSSTSIQAAAERIVALRQAGWHVEWSPVGSYIDVIAECQ
jgi:hypothetical protein